MIIGLHGLAGSGKDTVGKIIEEAAYLHIDRLYQIKKFSTKLKQIAGILLDVDPAKFEDRQFKESQLGPEWDYWTVNWQGVENEIRYGRKEDAQMWLSDVNVFDLHTDPESYLTHHGMTVRSFLQELGTEAMRDTIHPHIWINSTLREYVDYQDWIITDVRFADEVDAIHNLGGKVFWVDDGKARKFDKHKSETLLDLNTLDGWIRNHSWGEDGREQLKQHLIDMMQKGIIT